VKAFQPDGLGSLDMTLFQDLDGTTYFIRSVENSYVGISKLSSNFMDTTGIFSTIPFAREAPAMFILGSNYYIITSHLSGWQPNAMEIFKSSTTALSNSTTWISIGNPTGNPTSYNSQSTFVFSEFPWGLILLSDRWNYNGEGGLLNATYVWLPIMVWDNEFVITWMDYWNQDFY